MNPLPGWLATHRETLREFRAARVTAFHRYHPGSVEELLSRAVRDETTSYQWLARAVSQHANVVLDVACGSGRMSRELEQPGRTVIGLDLSLAELQEASRRGEGPWVCADATRLPLRDESVDAVISSMGLVVVRPLGAMLSEMARVLRPGGALAATVPTAGPLRMPDLGVALKMLRLMHTPPRYPGWLARSLDKELELYGLKRVEDTREIFRLPIHDEADVATALAVMWPRVEPGPRLERASRFLLEQSRRRGIRSVPVPIRRVVAMK